MGAHANLPQPMFDIGDFLSFTQSRPDEEKWELIDGRPELSPSANNRHQTIVGNLIFRVRIAREKLDATWNIIPGIGVKVAPAKMPVPDVLIRPLDQSIDSVCDDMIVAFEILSPSTADHDMRWKRRAYTSLASLQYYVIIAQDDVNVVVYSRASDFAEQRIDAIDANLDLPALGFSIPLREIYENTWVAGT